MVLVIDNLDSFTFNLVDLVSQNRLPFVVLKNDDPKLLDVVSGDLSGIMISPGPGRPEQAGLAPELVARVLGQVPILGVCLGHQLLGLLTGMDVKPADKPMHGKTSEIFHDGKGVFSGMPNPFVAMRYHSLVLEESANQDQGIIVSAKTLSGEIMAIRHNFLNFESVQFHPESILTEGGARLIGNWMNSLTGNHG
jgi:anthranilate synthase/aminodeoxychorismate synthase-like glutamine amidotransferase